MTAEQPEADSEPTESFEDHLMGDKHIKAIIAAFECLPVLARLDFVTALICDRAERDDTKEPELEIASEVLRDATNVLRGMPGFDKIVLG